MAKKTVALDGWTITLRVRVQKKKRKVNGRTRGRYESTTAHAIVTAPDGSAREFYLGSGGKLKAEGRKNGVELTKSPGGRTGGRKTLEQAVLEQRAWEATQYDNSGHSYPGAKARRNR